jgi:hypothetical protein
VINLAFEKRERPAIGIGGTADVYVLRNVILRFVCDELEEKRTFKANTVTVPFDKISVISPHKNNVREKSRLSGTEGVPSLLGFDFLQNCRISFSGDKVYLDLDEKKLLV